MMDVGMPGGVERIYMLDVKDSTGEWQADVVHLTSVHSNQDVRIFHKEAVGAARAGLKVALVAVGAGDTVSQGVHILAVPKSRKRLDRALVTAFRVFKRAMSSKARIIHYHDPELAPYAMLLKIVGRRIVIMDVHENLPKQILGKDYIPKGLRLPIAGLAWILERISSFMADVVIAATPSIAKTFPARKTIAIQNFPLLGELVASSRVPYSQRPPWFAYVGGISRTRGALEMRQAIAKASAVPEARLRMAGGFQPDTLRGEAETWPGQDRTDTLGMVSRVEVADLLGQSRAGLVLFHPIPNHVEAQPNKLFEYMSAGLPVIASDFPLWREIVASVGCGLLVDPLDAGAIARAMDYLLLNPAEAEAMGQRGQRAVEAVYNWGAEEGKLLSLYGRLLK